MTVTIELEISERVRQVTTRLLLPSDVGFSEIILIFWRTLGPWAVSVSLGSMVSRDSGRRTELWGGNNPCTRGGVQPDQKDAKCVQLNFHLSSLQIEGYKSLIKLQLSYNKCIRPTPEIFLAWLHVGFVFQAKLWLLCVIWEHYEDIRSGPIMQTRSPARPGKWWESQVFQEIFCPTWIMNHASAALHEALNQLHFKEEKII